MTSSIDKLYLLQLSTTSVPIGSGRTLEMASTSYLIGMSTGGHILIDSGFPRDASPPVPPNEGSEKTVLDHLRDLGLRPSEIDIVICSHFDIDHVGYHRAFPGADFIVQRRHYEIAQNGHARYATGHRYWGDPHLHYRLVDGDTELLGGLTLLETSGHAPGHQSVLVRLPRTGVVLLAIDAVAMQRLFSVDRQAWPTDDNEEELRASTRKLLNVVEREKVSLVVHGHDAVQWKTLRRSPLFYE